MKQFGDMYSQYYDLLYSDKDYLGEVKYIDKLITENNIDTISILDMGCGTGKHAEMLCDIGYSDGIDLSKDMLKIAQERRKGKEEKLFFTHSNIQELKLNNKFDTVVSLFHVMSYQNSNDELTNALKIAKEHLSDSGIFIFDFWYGPAVLTDLPTTRIKKLENDSIKVTRIAQSTLEAQANVVNVNYELFLENKKDGKIMQKKELHKMRYFFDTELELICKQIGFKIEKKYKWMSNKKPDFYSWNVVWVLRA
jgi:SAM-dependent methyltransferase